MCGRYTLYDTSDLTSRFKLKPGQPAIHLEDNYNVAPGQFLPVITRIDGVRQAELMKWGLIPRWAKQPQIGYKMINTRSETAFEKPFWRDSVRHRRCLVPARGFYEWQDVSADPASVKKPYYIRPVDQDIFAFAGIYDNWRDIEGLELRTFSILTTRPNLEISPIHNRMPVILNREQEALWLEAKPEDEGLLQELLAPYPDGQLLIYPVSNEVNSPKNNDARLIRPQA